MDDEAILRAALMPRAICERLPPTYPPPTVGIYWVCTGDWEGLGTFALLVTILGCIRVGTEKVRDRRAALLPPLFGTKSK